MMWLTTRSALARSRGLCVCAFLICHSVKVPWAAALPPDEGRGAPLADTAPERLRERARVAADRS